MKISRINRAIKLKSLIPIFVSLLITGSAIAGSPTTMVNLTNSCVASSMNVNNGGSIRVVKKLTGFKNCMLSNNSFATCNPGLAAMSTQSLFATAVGSQITMNPRCNWNCAGCSGITTDGASGGLPVELLEFDVDKEDTEE